MTMDLNTLEKIRAEVNMMYKKDFHTGPRVDSQEGCEDCYKQTEIYGHNQDLTDLITYLDDEIAKAKGVSEHEHYWVYPKRGSDNRKNSLMECSMCTATKPYNKLPYQHAH